MKLPSVEYLFRNARLAFLRFPLSLVSAFLAVCVAIVAVEFEKDLPSTLPYVNFILVAALGISLFFCIDVYAFSKGVRREKKLLYHGLAIVFLTLLYFTFPDTESSFNNSQPYIRFAIFAMVVHLLVAFVPFAEPERVNGFWQYNRILFVRFLVSMLFSGVLYAGLALAIGSLDFLFDVDLPSRIFFQLFIVVAGVFNTWFFLAGVPADFSVLDEITEYPRGLRIFSQFIMLPLVALYLFILYIYGTKILLLWSWPKGIVSYLVAGVSVLGILTLLLIYPYGNLEGQSWIKRSSRAFYVILLPLVLLLFISIGMRVADYGVTINRYVIIALGVWILITCIYFVTGRTNIKFIPISLAVMLVMVSFGFWGMFSVSERSQVKRLTEILESGNILVDGKIRQEVRWIPDSLPALYAAERENTNEGILSDSVHNEVKSILDYLDDFHGFEGIEGWFAQDVNALIAVNDSIHPDHYVSQARAYMKTMGLKYEHMYKWTDVNTYSYRARDAEKIIDGEPVQDVIPVAGYDYYLNTERYYENDSEFLFNIDSVTYRTVPDTAFQNITVTNGTDTIRLETGKMMTNLLSKYKTDYNTLIPQDEMTVYGKSDKMDIKVEFDFLNVKAADDSLTLFSYSGQFFIKLKK